MKVWLKALLGAFALVTACSLDPRSEFTEAYFTTKAEGEGSDVPAIPEGEYGEMATYRVACLQVIGADGKYASPLQEVQQQTTGSEIGLWVKFEVPKLWVGRKYNMRVIGFARVPTDTDRCPFDLPKGDTNWAQLGVLDGYVVPDKPGPVRIPVNFNPGGVEGGELRIMGQPRDMTTVSSSSSIAFQVDVNSGNSSEITYQWYQSNGPGAGADERAVVNGTSNELTLGSVSSSDSYKWYRVKVSDGKTTVFSRKAKLTVNNSEGYLTSITATVALDDSNAITTSWQSTGFPIYKIVWLEEDPTGGAEPVANCLQTAPSQFVSANTSYIIPGLTRGRRYNIRVCADLGNGAFTAGLLTSYFLE